MKSDFGIAHLWLGRSYLEVGRLDESLAATASAEAKAPEWPVLVDGRGYTLGVMGRAGEARAVADEMDQLSKRRFVTAYGMALVYAGLGEREHAFAWLEKAFAERRIGWYGCASIRVGKVFATILAFQRWWSG